MSAEVRRRLEALEQQPGPQGGRLTMVVQFVKPGETNREICSLRQQGRGMSFQREEGESQAAFVERAAVLAHGLDAGPVVLFAGT